MGGMSDIKLGANAFILTLEISSGTVQVLPEKEKQHFFLVGAFSNSMTDQKLMLNPVKF